MSDMCEVHYKVKLATLPGGRYELSAYGKSGCKYVILGPAGGLGILPKS